MQSGSAQFASASSFSDMVARTSAADSDLVAAVVEGRSALDTLIVKSGGESTWVGLLERAGLGVQLFDPESAVAVVAGVGDLTARQNELFRWETESDLILAGTPEGARVGTPDANALDDGLDAYASVGFFGDRDGLQAKDYIAADLESTVSSNETIIWPA